jgi:hypothetical protein
VAYVGKIRLDNGIIVEHTGLQDPVELAPIVHFSGAVYDALASEVARVHTDGIMLDIIWDALNDASPRGLKTDGGLLMRENGLLHNIQRGTRTPPQILLDVATAQNELNAYRIDFIMQKILEQRATALRENVVVPSRTPWGCAEIKEKFHKSATAQVKLRGRIRNLAAVVALLWAQSDEALRLKLGVEIRNLSEDIKKPIKIDRLGCLILYHVTSDASLAQLNIRNSICEEIGKAVGPLKREVAGKM